MHFDTTILGKDCIISSEADLGVNQNILVLGGTGTGKTMSIAEPRLMESYFSSLVVTVTKRRIMTMYWDLLASRGYEVIQLDFADPARSSIGWDPLELIRSEEDIPALATAIVMANPRKEHSHYDVFWDDSAIQLLSAMIALVLQTDQNPCFADVLDMLDELQIEDSGLGEGDAISTSFDARFQALAAVRPKCFALSCWRTFRQLPLRTSLCVFSTLNSTVASIFPPKVRQLFRMERKLRLEQISCRKTLLFVVSSSVNPALTRLTSVFYSMLLKELFEFGEEQPDGRLPLPVHLLWDDFAVGGRVLHFDEYISCFREKGIGCTLLLQSQSQLFSMYGEAAARTILDNSDSIAYLGGNDLTTAYEISLRANLPLEDILNLPIGEMYIFRRGQKPVHTVRYDIRADRRYKEALAAWKAAVEKEPKRIARRRDDGNSFRSFSPLPTRSGPTELPGPEQRMAAGKMPSAASREDESWERRMTGLEKAVKMKELSDRYLELYGEEDERTLAAMQNAANQYAKQEAYLQAKNLLERVYPLRLRLNGREDEKTLKAMAVMAVSYESLGEHRKAKTILDKLKRHGSRSMPELVRLASEECEKMRAARR